MTLNYRRLYKHLIKKGEDQTGPQPLRISQSLAMAVLYMIRFALFMWRLLIGLLFSRQNGEVMLRPMHMQ